MKTATRAVLALIVLALGMALTLYLSAANAAEPSKCGAFATGIKADGAAWTGAAPRMWVDRAGYWRLCQPWVQDGGDPEAPEPAPDIPCAGRTTYETWDGPAGAVCSSIPAGVTTDQTKMLRATPNGRVGLITDSDGNTRGEQIWRCVQGTWRLEDQRCVYLVPPALDTPKRKGRQP